MCGSCYIRKYCNWRRMSKLPSKFGYLFAFCYLDGKNSTKTDLHICNSWTGHLQVYNKFAQAEQQKVNIQSSTPIKTH